MLLKWKLPLLLLAIIGYLQYSLWFGKNNVFDYWHNEQIIQNMQNENNKLRIRNERMFAEIADLYDKYDAVEERARNELGMIKPDEHFYRIIDHSNR